MRNRFVWPGPTDWMLSSKRNMTPTTKMTDSVYVTESKATSDCAEKHDEATVKVTYCRTLLSPIEYAFIAIYYTI